MIQARDLGKRYHIGKRRQTRTMRDSLNDSLIRPIRAIRARLGSSDGLDDHSLSPNSSFWALQKVSFEVNSGEVLGLIGKNGSGKSTLLKILSRITRPTTGSFDTYGRMGALLEVGTGFHPDLTGRENTFLNGSILGMRRAEIAAKFDAIVDFAGIDNFIDTPVKHYSSGMSIRLAFSVAAHLDTSILLMDEVLSVGDAGFKRKSLDKMKHIAGDGRTVILVSHDMSVIAELCNRVMLLRNGEIYSIGAPSAIIADYEKITATVGKESNATAR